MSIKPHLLKKKAELEEEHDLLSEKIRYLRRSKAIETRPAEMFKIEKDLEQAESERERLTSQIEMLEDQIKKLQKIANKDLRFFIIIIVSIGVAITAGYMMLPILTEEHLINIGFLLIGVILAFCTVLIFRIAMHQRRFNLISALVVIAVLIGGGGGLSFLINPIYFAPYTVGCFIGIVLYVLYRRFLGSSVALSKVHKE